MTPAARDRTRWQRHGSDNDGRARRAVEAQQAAYEASRAVLAGGPRRRGARRAAPGAWRAVLAGAARRRDAVWRHAARASRRRATVALVAPLAVAIVLDRKSTRLNSSH